MERWPTRERGSPVRVSGDTRSVTGLPPTSLVRLCAVVDKTLAAVEEAATNPPAPRDLNDTFLGAAYGRAYRRMRSIRELAGRGEADDALILTRSLLLIVARTLYLVEPDTGQRGERRLAGWRLAWAKEALHTLDDLVAAGFEPDDDRDRIEGIVYAESARGTAQFPKDRDVLKSLGLSDYYARVYRVASDDVHYSIGSALGGFLEYPDAVIGGGRVPLQPPTR